VRIVRFVRETLRDGQYAIGVPVTITVGRAEENAHNNREMARALDAQGYDVSLEEVADMHNYVGWRDAFDPHLTGLLRRAWTPR
jgi:enterochelin esterase-like enzyme